MHKEYLCNMHKTCIQISTCIILHITYFINLLPHTYHMHKIGTFNIYITKRRLQHTCNMHPMTYLQHAKDMYTICLQ